MIGNGTSAALISKFGDIEWCCLPDFTSPSIFAQLLDREKGGSFGIDVDEAYTVSQRYVPKTNVLATKFEKHDAAFEVLDFMPRYKFGHGEYYCPPDIVRYIRVMKGTPTVRFVYDPRLAYGADKTVTIIEDEYLKSTSSKGAYESFYLYTNLDLDAIHKKKAVTLTEDSFFLLSYNQKIFEYDAEKIHLEYERTKVYWLNWVDRTSRFSRYKDEVLRSALVLKLLAYQKSGAILAAVTTSLPETIGEVRNWDYRYCWVRDASMIISTLTNLGHYNAAERFLTFIISIIPYKDEKMQIMYGIRGEKKLIEKELSHLSGYENSQPVRVGNAAYIQKQNDIYGVLIDIIHKYFRIFQNNLTVSEQLWTIVRGLVRTVIKNWKKPDMSIWEYRTQKKHFTFSKVLCWVALDRGVKIADLLNKHAYALEWAKVRDTIKLNILKEGWNPKVKAFTQAYGSSDMDAANLLMAMYGFVAPKDPKYVATVKRIYDELCEDGLMYRYKNKDDFGKPTSSFTVCSFWMVKSLYLIGEKKKATEMFEQLLGYANHVGLFSEDIDFASKRLLGNFPQGYSHLALIDAAFTLSEKKVEDESKVMSVLHTSY